jgi:hypothetical protein
MEEKKDCFAHKVRGYCSALTEMVCQRRGCTFYKTKEQFKEDAKRANEIIERKKNNVE